MYHEESWRPLDKGQMSQLAEGRRYHKLLIDLQSEIKLV